MDNIAGAIVHRMYRILLPLLAILQLLPAIAADDLAEIIVTSERRPQSILQHAGNINRLDAKVIERVQHQHIHELLGRAAGVWVVRGSGQEHQTAMRSPVLGGAGACGGFLTLEDSIPIRPANFCNINQLLEVNAEQARAVEVIRGPGNALFGSNALHGIVNVIMPMPGDPGATGAGLEVGANDFVRIRVSVPFGANTNWLAAIVHASDGGFREESGYSQSKLHLKRSWSSKKNKFALALSATELQQDTAGFIYGENSYEDPLLRVSNPNPDAFRDANSVRVYGIWTRASEELELDVRPYIRRSEMEFLHHASPGKPRENNGQTSAGVIVAATYSGTHSYTVAGIDVEWSDMFLEQFQSGPASGSPMQQETRPAGWHYDYGVSALSAAPFIQTSYEFRDRFKLDGGLRFEYTHYDYRNRMLSGSTRDDGTACGFGGCLYSRPADRTDSFQNLSPNLSANYQINANTSAYLSLAYGFRAPQGLELYRLQNGQLVSDLKSENVTSAEMGIRSSSDNVMADFVVFVMRKHDSIFRDTEGYAVNGARSRHRGIEASLGWQIDDTWRLSGNISYARHLYDFDAAGRGESFVSGNDIDTAPRVLGSFEILYNPDTKFHLGLQVTGIGSYFLDPGNQFTYSGHVVGNLRFGMNLGEKLTLVFRVNNVTDERIADRADYAARQYRYLPGRGRELFAELRYVPKLRLWRQ